MGPSTLSNSPNFCPMESLLVRLEGSVGVWIGTAYVDVGFQYQIIRTTINVVEVLPSVFLVDDYFRFSLEVNLHE